MDELDYFRLELPASARERLKNLDTKRTEAFLEKARVYPAGFTTHTKLIVGRLRDFKMVLIESGVPAEEHAQRLREHLTRVDKDMEDLMKIEARKLKEPFRPGYGSAQLHMGLQRPKWDCGARLSMSYPSLRATCR